MTRRYDNVRITNVTDGTTIEGHEAVEDYFKKEDELEQKHGSSLTFQVYRINLQATTLAELQGPKLVEFCVDGGFVSGGDTVAAVKRKLRPLIEEQFRLAREAGALSDLRIDEVDQISLSFSRHQMLDDKRFYADHPMLLPAWVQVLLHACDIEHVIEIAGELGRAVQR